MIFQRILLFSAGGLIILASGALSLLAAAFPQGEPFVPISQILLIVSGAGCILSAGYFYVGYYGERIQNSLWLRAIAAILLLLPISVTALPLVHGNHPEIYPISIPFLIFSVYLFMAFVWPCHSKHS